MIVVVVVPARPAAVAVEVRVVFVVAEFLDHDFVVVGVEVVVVVVVVVVDVDVLVVVNMMILPLNHRSRAGSAALHLPSRVRSVASPSRPTPDKNDQYVRPSFEEHLICSNATLSNAFSCDAIDSHAPFPCFT